MAATPAFAVTHADRQRGRMLLWAALVALVMVVLGILAVASTAPSTQPTSLNQTMFPDLAKAADKAVSIKIQGPTVFVTLNKGQDGKWVVAERSNYPASTAVIRTIVASLSDLKLVEQRTADPARQAALELTTGKDGLGTAVTLSAADGSTIAGLVAGKLQSRAAGSAAGTLFVRRPGEDQTWLARGAVALPASIGATLDRTLYTLDGQRLKSIEVALNGQKPYTLSRATPGDKIYTLDAIPDGKEATNAEMLGTPGTAVAGLTFDDVLKADAVKMEKPSVVTAKTFDGLVIKITLVPADENNQYALIEASVDPQLAAAAPAPAASATKPDPNAEVAAINARVKGWGYKMASFIGANLAPPLDTLVKDKAPAAPKPGQPAAPGAPTTPDGAAPGGTPPAAAAPPTGPTPPAPKAAPKAPAPKATPKTPPKSPPAKKPQ